MGADALCHFLEAQNSLSYMNMRARFEARSSPLSNSGCVEVPADANAEFEKEGV
jgi:hypothetical protein